MKTIKLTDFLTNEQIELMCTLKTATKITKEIIEPNIRKINKKLGQENDPEFLGYMCEYAIMKASGLQ